MNPAISRSADSSKFCVLTPAVSVLWSYPSQAVFSDLTDLETGTGTGRGGAGLGRSGRGGEEAGAGSLGVSE